MKKIGLMCMLLAGLYSGSLEAKVCFLASPDCGAGIEVANKTVNKVTCVTQKQANWISPANLCDAKEYNLECDDETGTFYTEVGCLDNWISTANLGTDKDRICAGTTKCGCCDDTKCNPDKFKVCKSPTTGAGDTCQETNEEHFVDGIADKFTECVCDTAVYKYNNNNCNEIGLELGGNVCEGDNGKWWSECKSIYNSCQDWNPLSYADGTEPTGYTCADSTNIVLKSGSRVKCLTNCSQPCKGYPYTSCPYNDGAIQCESCTEGGVTRYKAIICEEADGYYHSDGVCKPRDCSDYQLTDCPYASCTNMSFNKYSDENICISAGVKTYHLSYCGSYNVKTGYYLKKGSISCLPRDCSLFHIQKEPKNQIAYNACYSGSKTSYLVGRCKDGYYYRNVETDYGCVEKPITNVCDGFPLTSQPSFASSSIKEYLTCKEGTKNKYLIIECKSGYVVNGDYCSNSSSAFKYDACPENSICTSKSITNSSTKVTSVKYGVSKCVTGYHFDANGNCVENSSDCADFANSPIYDKTKHSVDNAAFCLAKNGNIYTMVGRCKPGHVPTGNTCVAKPTPYDMIGRHMYDGPCDPTLGVYCSGQATGVYFSENGYSSSGDYYAYLRGCDHGYHWNGYSCVANKCPDFPFTEKPANSKTYSGYISCYEGTTDGKYITKYRAIACEKGYRLNNHGCEPIE